MKPLADKSTQMWHTLSVEEVCARLESTSHGLAVSEAKRRLMQYGPNELEAAAPISLWAILAAQFKREHYPFFNFFRPSI